MERLIIDIRKTRINPHILSWGKWLAQDSCSGFGISERIDSIQDYLRWMFEWVGVKRNKPAVIYICKQCNSMFASKTQYCVVCWNAMLETIPYQWVENGETFNGTYWKNYFREVASNAQTERLKYENKKAVA